MLIIIKKLTLLWFNVKNNTDDIKMQEIDTIANKLRNLIKKYYAHRDKWIDIRKKDGNTSLNFTNLHSYLELIGTMFNNISLELTDNACFIERFLSAFNLFRNADDTTTRNILDNTIINLRGYLELGQNRKIILKHIEALDSIDLNKIAEPFFRFIKIIIFYDGIKSLEEKNKQLIEQSQKITKEGKIIIAKIDKLMKKRKN